jgi:hypothetical protein
VSKWEPPEEPDEGEIIDDDQPKQDTPVRTSLIKTPPLPDFTQIAVENKLM